MMGIVICHKPCQREDALAESGLEAGQTKTTPEHERWLRYNHYETKLGWNHGRMLSSLVCIYKRRELFFRRYKLRTAVSAFGRKNPHI